MLLIGLAEILDRIGIIDAEVEAGGAQ